MKLHLPKTLLVAVLAACGTLHAADQWGTPQFGGPEYTWTGSGDGTSYTDGANWQGGAVPARTSTDGPVLIFDDATVSVSGGGGIDTSDKGGIKAINGSTVSSTLGRWGGSIYVDETSDLTVSLDTRNADGAKLKNTEANGTANVYVAGKLSFTNTILNINDSPTQKWQIDSFGSVDISAAETINAAATWDLQYLKADSLPHGLDDVNSAKNRSYTDIAYTHQLLTSSVKLSDHIDNVQVIDKTTGNAVEASTYSLTYGDNGGLSISYTVKGFESASLETSGNITWAHGTGGWTITGADGTDTSFLNGDTVKFVGNGTASLQGEIIVEDISASDGVDYTVNMADNSSLTILAQQDSFAGGFKITGSKNTSLHLNMTTNGESGGDGRIMLAEGSSLGSVFVKGVFAYNTWGEALSSNLGGADLHLADGGVLLLRTGVSGNIGGNIGDIYYDGSNGEIRVYGSIKDAEVADNIYAAQTTLKKTDDGTITLSGTVKAHAIAANAGSLTLSGTVTANDTIIAKGGTLTLSGTVKSTNSIMAGGGNINITGTVTTNQLRLSEQGQGNVTISDGGKLSITGTNNNHENNASILLSHWGQDSKLTVAGGELAAKDTVVWASWTGVGSLEVTGGEANIKGLGFWGQDYTIKGKLILGNETSGTGRLNIGSGGINDAGGNNVSITLGNGTIGALADWKITYNPNTTPTPTTIQLVGANGGTVFDTTDATDKTTARTITVEVPMSGSGKLVKDGVGTLEVKGSMTDFNGSVEVKKGQMDLSGTTELSLLNLTVKAGAELSVGASGAGTVVVGSAATTTYNTESTTGSTPSGVVTLEGDSTITGDLNLSYATTLQLDKMTGTDLVTVTGDLTLPGGTLTLNGDILAKMGELVGGATLDIFSVGGAFNYAGQAVNSFTMETGPTLNTVFANGSSDYYLGYTMADGAAGTVYIGKVIPEPTTATLSLLALAALAARRRRK